MISVKHPACCRAKYWEHFSSTNISRLDIIIWVDKLLGEIDLRLILSKMSLVEVNQANISLEVELCSTSFKICYIKVIQIT